MLLVNEQGISLWLEKGRLRCSLLVKHLGNLSFNCPINNLLWTVAILVISIKWLLWLYVVHNHVWKLDHEIFECLVFVFFNTRIFSYWFLWCQPNGRILFLLFVLIKELSSEAVTVFHEFEGEGRLARMMCYVHNQFIPFENLLLGVDGHFTENDV